MSELWFTNIPPQKRMEISAQKILKLLGEEEKPFSILAEEAEKQGISKATLSKHLKRFVAIGMVERRVETSTYPPTVFYKLSKREKPLIAMFYEGWRAWLGEYPPPRDASVEETAKWVYAQTLLLLAETVKTLSPPPFILKNASDEEILEWWRQNNIENHFKILYKRLVEMHLDFCKSVMFNEEKLVKINEMLRMYALSLYEEALRQYGLDFIKVAEKIRKGESPKITRPVHAILPRPKGLDTDVNVASLK